MDTSRQSIASTMASARFLGEHAVRSLRQPFHLEKNVDRARDCVKLQESNHIYFNIKDHKKRYTSVTTFIAGFFEKFDGGAVLSKYYANWQRNPTHKYYGKAPGEILLKWKEKGEEASERGTNHHANIEAFYNETGTHVETPEFALFLEAMSLNSALAPLIPHEMERIIYSEALQLAGSMDGLFRLPAGHSGGLPDRDSYVILDWKFIGKYDGPVPGKQPPSWAKYGLSPATRDIRACHYHKYRIQLLIYAYILETEYDMPVVGLANVAFNTEGVELVGITPRRRIPGTNDYEPVGMRKWEYLNYDRDDELVANLVAERKAQLGRGDTMDPYFMYGSLLPSSDSLREWGLDEWDGRPIKRPRSDEKEEGDERAVKKPRVATRTTQGDSDDGSKSLKVRVSLK